MAKARSKGTQRKLRPALTPEAEEQQMISLAMDLVKQRLMDGTASSQETTHFLKLATAKERLNNEKLEEENKLLRAKTEAIQAQQRIDELYADAISAMRTYGGHGDMEDD